MTQTLPMQGTGRPADKGKPDGTNQLIGGGDSNRSPYPNPHTGKAKPNRWIGGQSDNRYYGGGQLGGDGAREIDNGLDENDQHESDSGRIAG